MLSVVVDLEGKFLILILEYVTLAELRPLLYVISYVRLCFANIFAVLHPWDSLFTCFRILSRFFLVFSTIRFIQQGYGQVEIAVHKG